MHIIGCGYNRQAAPASEAFSAKKISATVGGEPVVVLNAPKSGNGGLQILKVYISGHCNRANLVSAFANASMSELGRIQNSTRNPA